MRKQNRVSFVELAMLVVVLSIVAVVALPALGKRTQTVDAPLESVNSSMKKVKAAYAFAIAEKGNFPTLSGIVEFIDADFASETNDLSGIIFRDGGNRLTVNTFSDSECKILTNDNEPGVSDIVRCI